MQEVSAAWKEAHTKTLVPESFVEISMNVGDPDSQADASSTDNGHEEYSNVVELVRETEKNPARYATLESNMWVLDGTFKIKPSSGPYGENGYVGNTLCGDDGVFTTIPTITISFSKVFDALIPGLTITWATAYDEWADTFRVTAYNGDVVVAQYTVEGNRELKSVVLMDIANYNRITVEVLKWSLPCRRARIQEILVGIEKVYAKSELMNYTHTLSVDPLSAALPKMEIVFEIVNLNGEYNPDNPQGAEKYLMERQELTARYGYKIGDTVEWVDAGTFFMSEWDTPQNGITATFTARDSLEFMTDAYAGASTGTLYAIGQAALEQADLPVLPDGSQRWVIDSSLKAISAPAGVDLSEYPIHEVLQYVANAGCCVFYQDRSGVIHIEPLHGDVTDYRIDQDVSYSESEISLTKQLKAVNVNNGQYVLQVGTMGETQPITNPLISDSQAPVVAKWAADYLVNRRILSGNWRPDPRLDALDRITNQNQFAESVVLVTEVKYTYNGAFRGNYEGRAGV